MTERRTCASRCYASWLVACAGAGVLGLLALSGCTKPVEGPNYHSDIDHDGQPLDVLSHTGSAETQREHNERDHKNEP